MNEFRGIFNELLKENISILMQASKDSSLRNEAATQMKVTMLEASKNQFLMPIELQKLRDKLIEREDYKEIKNPGYLQSRFEKHHIKLL